MPDRVGDSLPVVPDLHLEVRIDPGESEPLPHPRRVGIDNLTEQKLGAYRDDLATHAHASR